MQPGDRAALERFLRRHADSTMFLRSNLLRAGLEDRGEPYQGTYAAAFAGEEVVGVACHYWNGAVLVEAPASLAAAVLAAVGASGRPVEGILGRWQQVLQARSVLGLDGAAANHESREGLFSLPLEELRVPAPIADGSARCRPPRDDEIELLVAWRVGYHFEALGETREEEARVTSREEMTAYQRDGQHWLLEVGGEPVAYSAFNARLPDCVQVGGVWTPPPLRGRGYGRSVVAGTLVEAARQGVERSVLFTDNAAAEAAYRSLGYRQVGEYGMVLFAESHSAPATGTSG